jgi:hypothetical protein
MSLSFRENLETYFTFQSALTQNGITCYNNVEIKNNLGNFKSGDKFQSIIIDPTQKREGGYQMVRFMNWIDQDIKFLEKKKKKEECPSN